MPKNMVISEGKTTNEAIEKGLKILKVSKDDVNIKVLENEDKRSFFSILAPRVVKVELTLKENNDEKVQTQTSIKKEKKPVSIEKIEKAEENVKVFLEKFLKQIGENITYKINRNEYGLEIIIEGKAAGNFIGYRGETLYALQSVISAVANKNIDEKVRILLDIENYKEKREKTLENLAIRLAKTVEKTGKEVTLEPMQAYERKIIHSCLQNSSKVKTESIGEEPRRRVVISLK
jgi:spoIIIJ-associated protein